MPSFSRQGSFIFVEVLVFTNGRAFSSAFCFSGLVFGDDDRWLDIILVGPRSLWQLGVTGSFADTLANVGDVFG